MPPIPLSPCSQTQKRQFLRNLPEGSPLKHRFLIERAAAVVVPFGLDEAVHNITGESLSRSPLSLDFAMRILQTLKEVFQKEGRSINLDLRLDCAGLPGADATLSPRKQLEIAGKLHARAGAGTATLVLSDAEQADIGSLVDLLQSAWSSTSVARLRLQRAGAIVQQGEFAIKES